MADNSLDITQLLDSVVGGLLDNVKGSMADSERTGQNILQGFGVVQQQMQREADANAVAANLKAANDQLVQNKQLELYGQLGVDPSKSNYVLTELAADLANSKKDLAARQRNIQKQLDTGFLDDPLGWVVNQITLPMDMESYQFAADTVSAKEKDFADLAQITNAAGATIAATTQINATELAKANAEAAAAKVAQALAQVQMQADKFKLDQISTRNARSLQEFELLYKYESLQRQREEFDFKRQELELRRDELAEDREAKQAERELRILQKNLAVEDAQRKREAETEFQKKLDAVSEATNSKRISVMEYRMMSPAQQQRLETLMLDPAVGSGRAGTSPAKALNNMEGMPGTIGVNILRQRLYDVQQTVMADPLNAPLLSKPAALQAKTDESVEQAVKKEAASIPTAGGIYSPPAMAALFQYNDLMKSSKLLNSLKPLMEQRPDTVVDPQILLDRAAAAVQKKELSREAAVTELTTIFKNVQVFNDNTLNYRMFSLPSMTDRQVFSNGYSVMLNGRKIDMTNPAQVENMLLRMTSMTANRFPGAN